MTDPAGTKQPRFAGWLPEALLVVGAAAVVVNWVLVIDSGFRSDPIWAGADVVALASVAVAVVRRKRPDLPVSLWLALMFVSGGAVTQTVLERLVDQEASATAIAWASLASLVTAGVASAAAVSAIGLYPSGQPETTRQRKVARAAWQRPSTSTHYWRGWWPH